MRILLIPVGLVALLALALVALNLGADWAAWVAAGSVVVLAFGAVFGLWPGGDVPGD